MQPSEQQFTPGESSGGSSRPSPLMWGIAAVLIVGIAIAAVLLFAGNHVRSDLSARDQELCRLALDDDEPIGYLSGQVDELIDNGGDFSSEGDAFAFRQVPVGRSLDELDSRIADFDQSDSAGYIDDPELLARAKSLRDALFEVKLTDGNSLDSAKLTAVRGAIDGLVDTCT